LIFKIIQLGYLKTGNDEDSMKELFKFSFNQGPNSIPISIGEWHGSSTSYYIFQCISPVQFTITVLPQSFNGKTLNPTDSEVELEDNNSIVIYTGKKIVAIVPKTFLQSYGTMLMIGAFFIVNMYIKSKQASMQPGTQSTTVPAAKQLTKQKSK